MTNRTWFKRRRRRLGLPGLTMTMIVLLGGSMRGGDNPAAAPAAPSPLESALRQDFLARSKNDQAARQKLLSLAKQQGMDLDSKAFKSLAQAELQESRKVDAENRQWLQKVVGQHGWPGRTLVGRDGAHAAWLLVQHADADPAFQKTCLRLMTEARTGEVDVADIAYLTDRIRLAEGKPQLYGTQVELKDGRWQVKEVEKPRTLDDRRQRIGLPPIDEYLRSVQEMYGSPTPTVPPYKRNK